MDAARRRVEELKLVLPLLEKTEGDAIAAARAKLADEQRRNLEKALRDLTKHSLSYAAHAANSVSAFRRLVRAGAEAETYLSEAQRRSGHLPVQLSGAGLRKHCENELNRLGLVPALESGVSAPGANAANAGLGFPKFTPHAARAGADHKDPCCRDPRQLAGASAITSKFHHDPGR